jgi:hypothetical protein
MLITENIPEPTSGHPTLMPIDANFKSGGHAVDLLRGLLLETRCMCIVIRAVRLGGQMTNTMRKPDDLLRSLHLQNRQEDASICPHESSPAICSARSIKQKSEKFRERKWKKIRE